MSLNETQAKSLLRKSKKIDSWFVSRYGMNPYRGCTHNCTYCDGRDEKYRVERTFGKDITIKTNAAQLLDRELNPKRKRKPLKKAFAFLGGGVNDVYQPVEKKYELAKQILKILLKYNFPVHILTKSILVKRDIKLLQAINTKSKAAVSMSFSTVDKKIAAYFEPGVPAPDKRLQTLSELNKQGITTGMYLMPVLPYISDTEKQLEASINEAKKHGIQFIIFGGLTLKKGRQKDYFMNSLRKYNPDLIPKYNTIYHDKPYGEVDWNYAQKIRNVFHKLAHKHEMPTRIPPQIFKDILDKNDFVTVLLEHIHYFLTLRGIKSPLGYAAYNISQLKEPLSEIADLTQIKAVNKKTEALIHEIIKTGSSEFYEKIRGW